MAIHARPLTFALLLAVTGACAPATDQGGTGGSAAAGSGGSSGGRGGSSSSAGGSGGSASVGSGGSSAGSGGSSAGSGGSSAGSGGTGGNGGSSTGSGGSAAGSGGSTGGTGGAAGSGGSTGGSGTDGGIKPDASSGTDTSSTGPLPPGTRKVYVLHDANAGGSANDPSRKSLMDLLATMKDSHGIVVELRNSPTKASEMMDAALIIVGPNSSMFGANHPDPGLKTVPIPVIVSKDGNTTEIGLGNIVNTPEYTAGLPVKIDIINADHPLAAGLTGTIGVLSTRCRLIRGQNVGPGAIKIATSPVDKTSYAIFAYEKGGMMTGGVPAPARRVGFFWHRPSAVTDDGAKLFKAAVDWALR
jgi:hypothetical protein